MKNYTEMYIEKYNRKYVCIILLRTFVVNIFYKICAYQVTYCVIMFPNM